MSQFTLCADLKEGRRPDFSQAMKANAALESFNLFVEMLKSSGLEVFCGQFGAYMKVSLVNDGPFTLVWSSN